jgi:hypothetical protein
MRHLGAQPRARIARCSGEGNAKGVEMLALVVVLLLIALLAGFGFALHVLWFVAVALLIIWLIGFLVRSADRAWYRW